MKQETHTVEGRTVAVFVPASPRISLLYLSDWLPSQSVFGPEFTNQLEQLGITLYQPTGAEFAWSNRPCAAFHATKTAEQWLLELPPVHGILGDGIGGQAALRLAFRHSARFPLVAAREPILDFHEQHGRGTILDELYERREQARQDTALLHIIPHQVPRTIAFGCSPDSLHFRGADRLHEKLSALGVAHTFLTTGFSWANALTDLIRQYESNRRSLL